MKTNGVLNSELIKVMATMGHGDLLAITDRGFPFPLHDKTAKIDLSVTKDLPAFIDVVRPVVEDFEIEEAIIAEESKTMCPEIHQELLKILSKKKNKGNDIRIKYIPHAEFKELLMHGAEKNEPVACFVKTGSFIPFANVILVSSVPF